MPSCKHRTSWVWMFRETGIEWCWSCGALRALRRLNGNTSQPSSAWARTSKDGKNPFARFQAENKRRGFDE